MSAIKVVIFWVLLFCAVAVVVASMTGCAGKNPPTGENDFIHAESTGLALGQQAVTDAEFETQELLRDEQDQRKMAKLQSQSRSHQTARDAMGSADREFGKSKATYDVAQTQIRKLKADGEKPLNKRLDWLITIGLLGGSIAVALWATGNLWAKTGAIAGVGLLLGSMMIKAASMPLYWFMVGLCVIGLAYIVRKLFIERRATVELVKTSALLLERVPDFDKQPLLATISTDIQSLSTEKLVDKAQADIACATATNAEKK